MAILGIDLGTTTCEMTTFKDGKTIPIPDLNGNYIIPSYVGVDSDGEFVFGKTAKDQFIIRPEDTSREFKRLMGTNQSINLSDKSYKPEELSAMLLSYLKRSAEKYLGEKIDEVIVTVPANFDDNQRMATMEAIKMAGLKCERIINEPTSAAIAYGYNNINDSEILLVYDFGGGTLDITILEMYEGILDVKVSYGDTQLGGKDFDESLKNLIVRKIRNLGYEIDINSKRNQAKLYEAAEKAKISLSTEFETYVEIENLYVDSVFKDIKIKITREEFNTVVSRLLEKSDFCVAKALEMASEKGLDLNRIRDVLLVGGTTMIPIVRERLSKLLGRRIRTDIDPIRAVSEGAAIALAIKKGIISPETGLIVTDVCPFSLGIEISTIVNGVFVEGIFHQMIERNATIPCERTDTFVPLHPKQEKVSVRIFQSQDNNCRWTKDAILIGEFELNMDNSCNTLEENMFEIKYEYDINGNLKVSAKHLRSGTIKRLEIDKSKIVGENTELHISEEDLEKSYLFNEYRTTLELAEKKLQRLNGHQIKSEIINTLNMLKRHIVTGNKELAEAVESKLIDLLMEVE